MAKKHEEPCRDCEQIAQNNVGRRFLCGHHTMEKVLAQKSHIIQNAPAPAREDLIALVLAVKSFSRDTPYGIVVRWADLLSQCQDATELGFSLGMMKISREYNEKLEQAAQAVTTEMIDWIQSRGR